MSRRRFIKLISSAALAWPPAALAQQRATPVVGYLYSGSEAEFARVAPAFRQGLREAGFVDDQDVKVEFRWGEDRYDRLPALAAELVRSRVTVIATSGSTLAALAAKTATSTIPIVFTTSVDPVEAGLVARLDRPTGNVTGFTTLGAELRPKWLELLHQLVPAARVVAVVVNPANPKLAESIASDLRAVAGNFGIEVPILRASREQDFESVFQGVAQLRAGALVIANDALFTARSIQLATLTLGHKVPAIFQYREFAAAGGLASYGSSREESIRLVGLYVGRILKGEKVADLPVQQSTKVELVINLKTAKALGLTISPALLARADEVIE